MKPHMHTGIEHAVILAIEVALVFHGFRFLAARLGKQQGIVGKIGHAVGGAFTFSGA